MNKKALLAISLAVLIPLLGYVLLKTASDKAVTMPRHYLPDSIVNTVKDGKMTTDTVWHKVANIKLVNQLGDTVNLYDAKGKIIVAGFFLYKLRLYMSSTYKEYGKTAAFFSERR
jgi:protein SCO1/2